MMFKCAILSLESEPNRFLQQTLCRQTRWLVESEEEVRPNAWYLPVTGPLNVCLVTKVLLNHES